MTQVESAWSKHPGYVIAIVPLQGTGRARVGDTLIAESTRCLIVRESEHRDQLYFPRQDIVESVLVETEHHTICPFKGEASYCSLTVGGALLENALWWYPNPMDEVGELAGYAAFYTDQVEVTASLPFKDADEATTRFPMWGTADDLLELMDPAPLVEGGFSAPSYPNPPLGTHIAMEWHNQRRNVVEGGQLLGAAIMAASKSRPDQRVTSAHMAFVKAASFDEPIHLAVEPQRRGSTLSVFDVKITQADVLRATGLIMTDVGASDVIRHVAPMPDVPPPAECPRHDFGVLGREVRVVDGAYSQRDGPAGPPELYAWTRFAMTPDSQALHQALLAQGATLYSIGAALRAHEGISEGDAHRTISTAPVSATVSFHDDLDVSDWFLTETHSIWAGRGSTQSQVRVFSADGRLVASMTVQAIVRGFERTSEDLQRDYSKVM
jgi:acyl-CoA thioesterase II